MCFASVSTLVLVLVLVLASLCLLQAFVGLVSYLERWCVQVSLSVAHDSECCLHEAVPIRIGVVLTRFEWKGVLSGLTW